MEKIVFVALASLTCVLLLGWLQLTRLRLNGM